MGQIQDAEFVEAVISTKKDAKLVAAAKNDRTNSPASMHREFEKLPLERRRDIINQISGEHFVAAQWKIAFPMNNFPAEVLPDAVNVAGKALFFTRDEDSVRESIRAIKIYQASPFLKRIAANLAQASETADIDLAKVAVILTEPTVFGMIRELDPTKPNSERIVDSLCRTAAYTRNLESTVDVGKFLWARRHFEYLPNLASIVENAIFLARDRRSVNQILEGFTAGTIDRVIQEQNGNSNTLAAIRDIAWKTRDWKIIRDHLHSYLT